MDTITEIKNAILTEIAKSNDEVLLDLIWKLLITQG